VQDIAEDPGERKRKDNEDAEKGLESSEENTNKAKRQRIESHHPEDKKENRDKDEDQAEDTTDDDEEEQPKHEAEGVVNKRLPPVSVSTTLHLSIRSS